MPSICLCRWSGFSDFLVHTEGFRTCFSETYHTYASSPEGPSSGNRNLPPSFLTPDIQFEDPLKCIQRTDPGNFIVENLLHHRKETL